MQPSLRENVQSSSLCLYKFKVDIVWRTLLLGQRCLLAKGEAF
uniref:Uncharacterized protein n=1 Tax=Rhizophora mucronata TaxID=61149 RepID=A0A2P2Q0L5_RHIMU